MTVRLAVDIGGTFTDLVLDKDGLQYTHKLLTTHNDPTEAVFDGIEKVLNEASVNSSDLDLVIHGTTLATNAIIERKGARTALLTTRGHRDVLEMAFENRFEQYDVNIQRPEPLIERALRIPVEERIGAGGAVLKQLDEESVLEAISVLKEEKIESVAVGFLHSYANSQHEDRVGEMLSEVLPDVAVTLSSQVCPEIREYERFSTTAANAYVLPTMAKYLNALDTRLKDIGCSCPCLMMTSGGGLTTLKIAARFPIRLIESGPAGGAILAAKKASELGAAEVISFDMGGTTAKICLIDDSVPTVSRSFEVDRRYRFKKGSGLPVRIPVIEMVEIGAGGGSIASVDSVERISVGPESAGSDPGPACYGRNGKLPTVTDADAILGRLVATDFAGGQMDLDIESARDSITQQFDTNTEECERYAGMIAEVVDENMALAARGHAAEWGKVVESRTMVAYGGAAPLHAARLMEKLDLDRVVIPQNAGVGSALGFLIAPISFEVVQSHYTRLSQFKELEIKAMLKQLETEATEVVSDATNDPLDTTFTALMRYVGQGYEISVPLEHVILNEEQLRCEFEENYRSLYGRVLPDSDIEIMSWTLRVSTHSSFIPRIPEVQPRQIETQRETVQELIYGEATQIAEILPRRNLQVGDLVRGPLLITEEHTTTVIPSGYEAIVNHVADLVLSRSSE